ncbi:hypothetical protein IQ265_03060 [Nodosilinea sp. LEGE 06152]|uniref:hypothetical protein n=1 Tax=Nodosilinea sp. LEGE 06152 TaxID=2777966 RepID=UPI0018814B80|nr:hypothetical protein [Nodosilinea sp. LEGE 06152]MBE9155816.1 hypothetical protein [Nodosilinea sp. LEGE 06152]
MFLEPTSGDESPVPFTLPYDFAQGRPTYRQETLRHILLGDYGAITDAISQLVALGYSDRVAWSDPIPTGRSGEYVAVMTRRRGM